MVELYVVRLQVPECAQPTEGVEADHVYMPMLPLRRLLPAYRMKAEKQRDCNKYAFGHKGLTPGIFLMYCAQGVCLGFKLLPRSEGPSAVHDVLFTRLSEGKWVGSCFYIIWLYAQVLMRVISYASGSFDGRI